MNLLRDYRDVESHVHDSILAFRRDIVWENNSNVREWDANHQFSGHEHRGSISLTEIQRKALSGQQ
jgi:hypothetical protein